MPLHLGDRRPPGVVGRAGGFLRRELARAGVAEVRRVRTLDADALVAGLASLERIAARRSSAHLAGADRGQASRWTSRSGRPAARIARLDAARCRRRPGARSRPPARVDDQAADGGRIAVARLADAARVDERPPSVQAISSIRGRARSARRAVLVAEDRSGGGCGRAARTGSSGRRGSAGRPAPR